MSRSQSSIIIDYLARGKSITPIEALERWGVFRLGARIYGLRRDGHRIKSELVRQGSKRFARYTLA